MLFPLLLSTPATHSHYPHYTSFLSPSSPCPRDSQANSHSAGGGKDAAKALMSGAMSGEMPGGKSRLKKMDYIASYGTNTFYTNMCAAPCANCPWSFLWCVGGTIPFIPAQCFLRKKLLDGDLTKYKCFQGNVQIPGINIPLMCMGKPTCKVLDCGGKEQEQACPDFFLFAESILCLVPALTANRQMLMKRYELQADPWDNRVIWCNNGLVICLLFVKKKDCTWGCCQVRL